MVGTDLANYAKSIVCKDGNGTGSVVANTTTDDAGPLTVPVDYRRRHRLRDHQHP